jgi:hypothetical protein
MTGTTEHGDWALSRHFWVIVMRHPSESTSTLLQAEDSGTTYLLAFTSEDKAVEAIDLLGLRDSATHARAAELRPSGRGDSALELVSAVCRLGATGIMVDFEADARPGDRRWAWRRRLVANA